VKSAVSQANSQADSRDMASLDLPPRGQMVQVHRFYY